MLPSPGGISSLQATLSGHNHFMSHLSSRIGSAFIVLIFIFFLHLHNPKYFTSIKHLKEKENLLIYLSILVRVLVLGLYMGQNDYYLN